jgi:hypothetical protein
MSDSPRRFYATKNADAHRACRAFNKERRCCGCGVVKPAEEFPVGLDKGVWRLGPRCRSCISLFQRNRRATNPTGVWARAIAYIRKYEAKKAGVPFAITNADIQTLAESTSHCPVLGVELDYANKRSTRGGRDESPSLDRIRPEAGYVSGNVAVMSAKANCMKNNATAPEHARLIVWLMGQPSLSDEHRQEALDVLRPLLCEATSH